MCRHLILLLLSLTYLTEARYGKKLQSVVIVGTVYCNTCSDINQEPSKSSHLIPGAFLAVECKDGNLKQTFRDEATTDTNGVFRVHLPSRHVKIVEGCSVELIKSSEPYCGVASMEASSSFRMESKEQGSDVFSTGFFTFKPVKKPNFCNSKLFDPARCPTASRATALASAPSSPTFSMAPTSAWKDDDTIKSRCASGEKLNLLTIELFNLRLHSQNLRKTWTKPSYHTKNIFLSNRTNKLATKSIFSSVIMCLAPPPPLTF